MIFHKLPKPAHSEVRIEAHEIEASRTTRPKAGKVTVSKSAVIWTGCLITFFAIASIVAHQQGFEQGQTVFLNLTVVLTSAGVGAFLGERLTVDKLT